MAEEAEDELLNLPILPAEEDDEFFVLLPGLDRGELKKWQATWSEESLLVEVYYGGIDEEGNLRANRYPIRWPEGWDHTEEDVRLIPVNPIDVNFKRYFDEDEAQKYKEFFEELEEKF